MGTLRELPLFSHLVHADWSKGPAGRWAARASFAHGGWSASAPCPVGPTDAFVTDLFARAATGPVLAGFDFPIGLPIRYARALGLPDFPTALDAFGSGVWTSFYTVAETPQEIGRHRPFYPQRSGPKGTVSRHHLIEAHGLAHFEDLARRCERKTAGGGKSAGMMFWTLGAASPGKAALHGWQTVIGPARRRGATLWPFDDPLAAPPGVTLAETYPGDAYGQIGLPMTGKAKTSREDRRSLAPALLDWAAAHRVAVDTDLAVAINDGFGPKFGHDDGFDALVGLFAMIAVANGDRAPGAPEDDDITRWEGWILGREA